MKNIKLLAFVLAVIIQLYVPAKMIMEQESIIKEGTVYRFQTAPIDPPDPFRGRYVRLNFNANSFDVPKAGEWEVGQKVYVLIQENPEKFAEIKEVRREAPKDGSIYVQATIQSVARAELTTLFLQYPFHKFYMEEFKAPQAEKLYREIQWDSTQVAYAIVKIREGKAVLEDLMVNDQSIGELVK